MKKKEIFIVMVAVSVMGVSIYLMLQLLSPSEGASNQQQESEKVPTIPSEFDEKTYKNIENLSDYGLPNQENIGKSDLFTDN